MKKTFLLLLIIFVSCQKKQLPPNISSALWEVDIYEKINREHDSLICTLDESKINNLSIDSLESLISKFRVNHKMLQEREDKVDELLKYNPEYSDYDEIKNREVMPLLDSNKNYDLILKRHTYLINKKGR